MCTLSEIAARVDALHEDLLGMSARVADIREDLRELADALPEKHIGETNAFDRKTVEQAVIKLTEEVGEVARAIGTLTGVHGSEYRDPVSLAELVDELADVRIVLYSLAGKLGVTSDALDTATRAKVKKWRQVIGVLQDAEHGPVGGGDRGATDAEPRKES